MLNDLWHWQGIEEYTKNGRLLNKKIGDSMIDILREQYNNLEVQSACDKIDYVILTKSPVCRNMHLFEKFFPHNQCIIVARHPYDSIQSMMKAFHMSLIASCKQWNEGAENYLKVFSDPKIKCVKYEDLINDRTSVLTDLIEFINLNSEEYPYYKARNIGVFCATQESSDGVKWEYSKFSSNQIKANPLTRFEKSLVNIVCGLNAQTIGYRIDRFPCIEKFMYIYLNINAFSKKLLKIFKRCK